MGFKTTGEGRKVKGRGPMGSKKHGKSGKATNSKHFTGKKSGKKVRRKGKGLTRKQRKIKHGKHVNKYAGMG